MTSTIIDLERMMPFSTAINTVLLINRFNMPVSFKRSFLCFINVLELITSSFDAISKKYIKGHIKTETLH